MDKITIDSVAYFTWSFGSKFFLEINGRGYVWYDPDYGGNNTIVPFNGNYKDWCKCNHIPFGRDKGEHRIGDYCGTDVVIQIEEE